MGIYIKGIEMPKVPTRFIIFADGRVEDEDDSVYKYSATLVSNHGRLGDLDALYRRIKTECNPYGSPTIGYDDGLKVLGIIGSTPPIIPADKEGEA